MNTIIMKTNEAGAFETAAKILKNGGLVAFPTETVYGLGGDALRSDASMKIYAAKGRPSDNPLIVHIADFDTVYQLAEDISDAAKKLMEVFWPGPLTIVLKKKEIVPKETTGGLETVAVRMPIHPDAAHLIRKSGVSVAAPSANTSGRPSPTTAQHCIEDLNGRIDMILDGGSVGIGIESTIVDMTGDQPTILRPGYITEEMLEAVIGPVAIDRALLNPESGLKPKAPGMKYTHYAPKGTLTIVESAATPSVVTEEVVQKINQLSKEAALKGHKVIILTTKDMADRYAGNQMVFLGDDASSDSLGKDVASHLYAALRKCDELGADIMFSESFQRGELGGAIMNRLLKAAGHRVISV